MMASGGRETILSSDDESLQPVQKCRRKPKPLASSDSDDDSDIEIRPHKNIKPLDCESEDSDDNFKRDAAYSSEPRFCSNTEDDFSALNDNSDNEQSEKCAICLSKFSGQDIATPETCDHMFCLECLQEWAKNVNTCPIDRLKFNLILIRHHKEDKIFKRIFVNCPELPWLYESDSESNIQTEISSCGFCGEHDNEDALLPCRECHKTFHIDCLIPPPIQLSSNSRICPCCGGCIRIKRLKSRRLDLHDTNSLSSALGMTHSEEFTQHSTNQGLWRLRQKTHELIQRYKRRRVITSSESSDEEIDPSNISSVQFYQNQISSKSQCPLIQKRRREICRSHNRALISSAATTASNSELYSFDSDDGINETRYESYDRLVMHPSSTSRTLSSSQRRDKMISTESSPDNFDLVGSILQSQTLLHRSDVLTLKRDGTLLLNSDANSPLNSPSSSPLNSPSATSSSISVEKNEENSPNHFFKSSVFDNKSVLPYPDGAVYNQRPMNPSQNTNSKYRETPRENYSCSSSTTSIDPSIDYDNGAILARNTLDSSGNEKYNNDNSCSSVIHKSFCGSTAADDIKKVSSNFKESNKGHHSEDEVDIYSDIESVGEDEGVCNTVDDVNDRIEPMKIPYKADESPSSNPGAASDSSDNELVIDEDMAADEETDNRREIFPVTNSNNKTERAENTQVNESDDSNASYTEPFSHEQADTSTPDVQDENCSFVDSRSVDDIQLGEESSQGTFQDNTERESYKNESEYDENKNESGCDENKNESDEDDDEDKNESDIEDKSGSFGEDKNESEDEDKNESEPDDKNESEIEVEAEEDKNHSECDDQESDMDVQVDEENSLDSPKKSPRAETSTPCSTISSKQFDEDMKQESLEGHCDNSISSENQEYCDTIDNDDEIGKKEEINENTNDSISQAEENENYQNDNNSNLSFESVQLVSESEELMDSNIDESQKFSEEDKKEQHEVGSDVDMKSDNPEEEGESAVNSDNIDISENASTPCLDEHIDGQIENSPVHDTLENTEQYSKLEHVETRDFDQKSDRSLSTGEYESCENDKTNEHFSEEPLECKTDKVPENSVDLGIEDISEAGSGDLDDDFGEENMSFSENKKQIYNDDERDDLSNLDGNDGIDPDSKISSKELSENVQYHSSPQNSNQSYDDREEGEIIEEKPVSRKDRKRSSKYDCYLDEKDDYAPRVNICDLPRIPKIKRDRERDSIPHELPIETKRTSVLGRVDLGGGDISWKRLSKHNRERSYRDGRPKDERVLYRERESRKKDKKYNDNEWRSDSKSSRRDDSKKQDSEKYRNDYESRSRKNDKKDKVSDWSYSDRDKRSKSHKEKHKDKHKDKKDKSKHEKNKYSKEESKYSKIKDEDHYDREIRFDKEQRYERIVYEKGKFKEKDHKSKHKDRKGDTKSSKDHSREKHKHIHTSDHFSDKQREREVRKIDDKIKVVVEQKDARKEKTKHKDKKDSKHDKKQIHHHEHRKKEIERSPYAELSSIESKEIFAKGDSIIINVNFNRTSSPKDVSIENADSNFKEKKNIEDFELDEAVNSEKSKGKHSLGDKGKALEASVTKRPTTPPERTNQVLSVSESYWQGGDDSDANNSPTSDKSVEEVPLVEEENETMESADEFEGDNLSNSCNSVEVPESQPAVKEGISICDETSEKPEKVDNSFSKEVESIVPSKRRSPRSPSPPSPADNDSYDPCEPTRSPSPPPVPPAPPLPLGNPKPPPSPELPPLPPEPEPIDNIREETTHKQNTSSEFIAVSSVVASNSSQPTNVISQVSVANAISLPSILLPPPSFLSHTAATTNSLPTLSSLLPPRNFNFQVNNHPNVIFPPNHVQQVIQGIVPAQLHAGTAIPPPPNPPSLPHMGSVPPPPPPPSAMALISQVRHPQINVQPALSANSLLQNLTLGHPVTLPQMQLSHLHHIPPNLSNPLSQPMLIPSQNQSVSLPVSIQNQPVSRVVLPQNQMLNHTVALQNQNNINSKPQNNIASHLPLSNSTPQKPDKISTIEKQEVVDMEVDSPYSPGDSPSMDSVCDYSPTCSPLPSTPKSKDIFDSLLPSDHRTTDRKTQETPTKAEKSKRSDFRSDVPSKKSKHEHKADSGKVRHAVRMQISDKGKVRKEQKTEKKLDDSQLKILDELPSSAVEMQVKEKFLKKLNRQERVVEEVKLALKPYYKTRDVTKEEYKDILRKSVPKICHNRSGEINPMKVKTLVECYIKKIKHSRKKADKKKSSKLS